MSNSARQDKTIYLDYAATTPMDKNVIRMMLPFFSSTYGNASSMYQSGRKANQAISESRVRVAKVLGSKPEEIIFTGSGTESDNLALLGIARANKTSGRHIIVSAIEHKAIIESAKQLAREGFKVSFAPVHPDGLLDLKAFEKLLQKDTILVSIMYANNEIGTIEPIREISRIIKKYRREGRFPIFHTDACQVAGFLEINVDKLGVDLLTLNGSKIYGPKGSGILYKRNGMEIEPIILGGEQERGLRAGTESVALIVGISEALRQADERRRRETERLTKLRDYFIDQMRRRIPEAILNGHPLLRLPNNAHFSFPNIEGESILLMLDQVGIEASTGSACSASDLRPSHVLLALGSREDLAHGSIRFSFGRHTNRQELDYCLAKLPSIVERLKALSSLTAKI